jgi:hypothetical protein
MILKAVVLAALFPMLLLQAALADCDADLADSHQRIAAVKARDPEINALVKKHDITGACAIVRTNLKDMTVARDARDRCLTGFDRREEVAEMNASIADMSDVLTANCRD